MKDSDIYITVSCRSTAQEEENEVQGKDLLLLKNYVTQG